MHVFYGHPLFSFSLSFHLLFFPQFKSPPSLFSFYPTTLTPSLLFFFFLFFAQPKSPSPTSPFYIIFIFSPFPLPLTVTLTHSLVHCPSLRSLPRLCHHEATLFSPHLRHRLGLVDINPESTSTFLFFLFFTSPPPSPPPRAR